MKKPIVFVLLITVAGWCSVSATAAENLDVLPEGADKLVYEFLLRKSKQRYEERATHVRATLQSLQAIARRPQGYLLAERQ